jgi:hypothetical protein
MSGTSSLPTPCASKLKVIVKRDRRPPSSDSTVPLTMPTTGPLVPRTAQLLGRSSSTTSSVVGSLRGPTRRTTMVFEPTASGRESSGRADATPVLPFTEVQRVDRIREHVVSPAGDLDALDDRGHLASLSRSAVGSRSASSHQPWPIRSVSHCSSCWTPSRPPSGSRSSCTTCSTCRSTRSLRSWGAPRRQRGSSRAGHAIGCRQGQRSPTPISPAGGRPLRLCGCVPPLGFAFTGDKVAAIDVIADPPRLRQLDLAVLQD